MRSFRLSAALSCRIARKLISRHASAALKALGIASLIAAGTAWGQTPTLVQHFYTGTNSPPRGLNAPYYTFRLPNKTLAGNTLVMFLDYPHGSLVASITDDRGNAWPTTAAAAADGGVGSPITAVYVLPNAATGTREVTVTFDTDVTGIHAAFLEYYNVDASAAVGSTASRNSSLAPTITSGTLAPSAAASGNLVLNYAMDNYGQVGGQSAVAVNAWAAGDGWTMLGGDINNSHDASSFALQARIADGTNFNPTMTATQSGADGFNSVAVELRGAKAGTAPSPGIRILKQQFYVHTALEVPGTWEQFFPAQGNLLAMINIYQSSTVSPLTDSNGNQWTLAHTDPGAPPVQYAQNARTSSTLEVAIPLTDENSNTTIVLFDITGAATSDVLAQAVTVNSTNADGATTVLDAPTITPQNPNGLILVASSFGQGPVTGLGDGAPPTAVFMPVTYPGETDLDTFNNADAYANNNYGTDLATQHYNWTLLPQPANSWDSAAVEFKSATGSALPPSGLTATAASATQINLAWTAPANATATSYLVERCLGSSCTDFAQATVVTTTTYSDTGLAASTVYRYRVRADLTDATTTDYSNIATATTFAPPDSTPPSVPNLSATEVSASRIDLTWTAASDDVAVTGYRVERCQGTGCTTFAQIGASSATSFGDSGLAGETSYSYRVRASDAAGNLSDYSNVASATTPKAPDAPPTAPTGLNTAVISSSQIDLAWTAATDDVGVTGYRVERCEGTGCTAFAEIGAPSTASFNDTGLADETSYSYRVRAIDTAGNLGGYSNVSSASTSRVPDTTPPSAPTGLTTAVISSSQIDLAWTAATDNVAVTGYRVSRCQGSTCSNLAQLATVTSTSYVDTTLSGSTTYRYSVQAVDAAGNASSDSNIVSATTPAAPDVTPPSAPAALSATVVGADQISLAWGAASDNVGVTGYRLERCQGAGCSAFAEIAASSTASFNDTAVAPGTSYSYRVRAVDAAGNLGGYSNIASASIAAGTPPGTIAFVQGNYATPQSPTATVSVQFTAAQSSGDLNVVIVGWNDSRAVVTAVTDSAGNTYSVAAAPTVNPGAVSQTIYYAKNIAAAPAGNTVTVQFSADANYPDIRILSYSGLDRSNPLDVSAGASGNSGLSDSGLVTTTSDKELLVAGNTIWSTTQGPGAGFTSRMITVPDSDIAQDQVVDRAGSYRATAPIDAAPWVMQLATFRAASN